MLSEKKVVGRSVAIALGLVCILLIALIAYFTVTGISAQNSYNNLKDQNKQLQTWLDGNETLLNQTQANNTNLQNQVNSLTAPKLIEMNLTSTDLGALINFSSLNSSIYPLSWLNVKGFSCNVGKSTAYNCTIHVVAYSNSSVAIDTNIILGTMSSYSLVYVDDSLPYYIFPLTNWTITPQWTATP
jgi:cell division protein FtsB